MKIKNFDEATKELQTHLADYLELKGIDSRKNFKCINPAHEDSKPSMSIVKDSVRVYCHGCAATGDIFDACAWLERKPLTGQGFMTETLPYLAKLFSVQLEHTELTEEEQYQLDTLRAYRHACEYITNWNGTVPEDIANEIKRRGWEPDSALKEAGVGFISDHTAFRTYLKDLGFSATFLDDVDLGRKDLFAPGHLIFTVKDEGGRPVGFAARNLLDNGQAKYVNQRTTGVKCNIYQKGKRLYGLDVALRHKNEGPLYIMEGYPDVLACHLRGFNRAVATCGTSLTDDHLLLLKEHGVYEVVFCYDADDRGQERTETLLDNKFSHHKDISVSILTVPAGKDPDEYITENGIDSFTSLKPITAFSWRLHRFDETAEPEVICKKMIPLVVSEPSHISREKMLIELSKFTGFQVKTLQAELNRMINDKERTKGRERQLIIDQLTKHLQSDDLETEIVLAEAQAKLFSLKAKYDEDSMSEDSTIKFITDIKNKEESNDGKNLGFNMGEDLREFANAVLGEMAGTMSVFGGKANSGKTSFLVKLAYEIARHDVDNNAIVIYHTIDDSAEQLLPKFICVGEGSTQLEINQVKSPNYYKNQVSGPQFESLSLRREQGYSSIISLIRNGRLVLKDATDGMSLGYAEGLIRYYQEKYPGRQVVYILDNFHKLRDFEGLGDERVKFKIMSQTLKQMAVTYRIPVLCTMEYTKLPAGVKPTNDNIAETVQMEYDANLIVHLWNGSHDLGDKATEDMYHTVLTNNGPERKPIVELNVGKNKITSFKSKIYMKFFPSASDWREHPIDVALAAQQQVQEDKKKSYKSNGVGPQGRALFAAG